MPITSQNLICFKYVGHMPRTSSCYNIKESTYNCPFCIYILVGFLSPYNLTCMQNLLKVCVKKELVKKSLVLERKKLICIFRKQGLQKVFVRMTWIYHGSMLRLCNIVWEFNLVSWLCSGNSLFYVLRGHLRDWHLHLPEICHEFGENFSSSELSQHLVNKSENNLDTKLIYRY